MKKKIQSFEAHDTDGTIYHLEVWQDFHEVNTSTTRGKLLPGLKEIITSDGDSVNRLAKGEYQIVQTGACLRSDDPDAP